MVLASDAVVRDGEMIGDPTEGALVVLAEKGGIDAEATRAEYPRVGDLPFDAAYKLMATFHRMQDADGRNIIRCFVKGAPDQLLARAAFAPSEDLTIVPIDDELRRRYMAENQRLGEQGLRVLATARKDFDTATFDASADLLPQLDGLTVLALAGIVDPARPAAKASIATAKSAGIRVRMITGDHAVTAKAIADQLGIEGRAITGADFGAMSDDELLESIDDIGVIARVTPEHKVRLVETLKRKGQIVAMTGDGVNDAPALKKADIGIAMGITGTEVSKEAAAMILTDDNFATIVKAVELGRGLYDNLTKYIRFQMGVLVGFIVTFLGASIFNIVGGVPLLPLQTLYGKPADGLMGRKPRAPDEPMLNRGLLVWLGCAGLVMGAGTLGVIWWASDHHTDAVARTMGLVTFSFANLFFSFVVRDEARSVFSLDVLEDKKFISASAISFAAIVLGAQLDLFHRILQTVDLTLREWLMCFIVGFAIVLVSEGRKLWLRRKHAAAEPEPEPAVA
jgi:Ca2+-transporting ATPase